MRLSKRVASAIMSVMVALTLVPTMAYAASATGDSVEGIVLEPEASTSTKWPSSLKAAGIKFDLKKNKAVTINMYARGTKGLKYNSTVSKVSVKTLKSGKKQATFNVTWKLKGITTSQSKAILKQFHTKHTADEVFGEFYYLLVDYNTGLSLENPSNKFKVKVSTEVLKDATTKTYTDSDNCWFRTLKEKTTKVTVTYPAKYTGLCIGFGGSNYARGETNKAGANYWAKGSKYRFYQTSMYKKFKSDYHFMRIK